MYRWQKTKASAIKHLQPIRHPVYIIFQVLTHAAQFCQGESRPASWLRIDARNGKHVDSLFAQLNGSRVPEAATAVSASNVSRNVARTKVSSAIASICNLE